MSIQTVSGTIVSMSTKGSNYSIKLDDGEWYSGWLDKYKKTAPAGVEQDAFVEVRYKQNGQWKNIEAKGGITVQAKPTTQAASGAAGSPSNTGGGYAEKDLKRQREIRWHSSRNAAIEHARLALEAGSIDFGKCKVGEKMDVVTALVEEFTERFYVDAERVADNGFELELPGGLTIEQ